MAKTRYKEERTLVRAIRRLPNEDPGEYKKKIRGLRKHFEQFNIDTSEICQWLMSVRPDGKNGSDATEPFWKFFLEPEEFFPDEDVKTLDKHRRVIFDVSFGLVDEKKLPDATPESLRESMRVIAGIQLTPTADALFKRLIKLHPAHRQVLLKAAAEWVVARYWRGVENWKRQREVWEEEKAAWEKEHPEITENVRDKFNGIIKELGIRKKRPRLCYWERLEKMKEACEWNGKRVWVGNLRKNHSALCDKYCKFRDRFLRSEKPEKRFRDNARQYLRLRKKFNGKSKQYVTDRLYDDIKRNYSKLPPRDKWEFPKLWRKYLRQLDINENTILKYNDGLPHCVEFGNDKDCEFNKHTDDCVKYRELLSDQPELQPLEKRYREWRRDFLAGPRKPSFRYPSKDKLPMPKIFGKDFFKPDFENSVLSLRLDDMPENTYETFGFNPWPKGYNPQPDEDETEITSVNINFIGSRARAGFRFSVPHKESRFNVPQEEIEELRSRKYPRESQDQGFLNEARALLIKAFPGDAKREMRFLTVDLGTTGCGVALFEGRQLINTELLEVIKIDDKYAFPPMEKVEKREIAKFPKEKGLREYHVGRHLKKFSQKASELTIKRGETGKATLRDHDMRGLTVHIQRMIKDWVRHNTSQIIENAERNDVDLIVFESMRGFKAPGYDVIDDDKKRRLATFSYGRIRRKVTEKAVERGMRVITVPYRFSSQVCAECGVKQEDRTKWAKNKKKHYFECECCEHKANSDENAAHVLAKVFWGDIILPEKGRAPS